jgi:hypothetical protein
MAASWPDQGCNRGAIHNDQGVARHTREVPCGVLSGSAFGHVHNLKFQYSLKDLVSPGEFRRKFQVHGTIDHLI